MSHPQRLLSDFLVESTTNDRIAAIAAILDWDPETLHRAYELATADPHALQVTNAIRDAVARHNQRPVT